MRAGNLMVGGSCTLIVGNLMVGGGVLHLKVTPSDQGGKTLSTDANGITEGQFKKLTIKGKCAFKDGW